MINSVQTKKPGERQKEGKRGSSRVQTHTHTHIIGDLRLCETSCFFYSVAFCEVSHPGQIIFLANERKAKVGLDGGLTGCSGRFVWKRGGEERITTGYEMHVCRNLELVECV